ncbi:MAG: PAS domain S-box protein [Thiobacillus sp.]|nr:PAS domain S-box protein [Thiobacillus sp.]
MNIVYLENPWIYDGFILTAALLSPSLYQVNLLYSKRYPDRHILAITFLVMLVLLVLDQLIDSFVAENDAPGMFGPAGLWSDNVPHVLLAMFGALLLYRYVQPFAQKLRESQTILTEAVRKNELILQHAGEGIYGLDNRGRMTFVNAAAERMLGYSNEDMGHDLVHHITHRRNCKGCSVPVEECSILATCHDGALHLCDDAIFWRKDGRPLDVQYISAPILEAGLITGAVVVFSDNTERKRNEATLTRCQHIFDHAEWGVIVFNVAAGQIELINPAFARMHGYRVDELAGWSIAEFFAEECRADLPRKIQLIHETGHHIWESWHVRKDGSRFPVQIDATAVKDEAGEVLYRVVNVQDITARRQIEDTLRESEAHLAQAQAQGKLGSWRLDIPNDVLEWSAEGYRIFGMPPGTPLNYEGFLNCVHPDDRDFVNHAWRAAVAGAAYDIQHRIIADGKMKWVRERAELEYSAEGEILRGVGTIQDITELKRHEDELLRSRQSLRELAAHHEKVREGERTRIAREIHDELGQHLTALRMDAAMLNIRFGADHPDLARQVAGMKKTIDTTIGVVRNLATSLRPGALDMGLVSAAEWLLSGFEERTQIRCHLHAPEEHLDLDEECGTAAFRILQESLTNITRYASAVEVNVRIEWINGILEMDIRDDGVGFDPAEVRSRKTFGLMGMRERALQFGGESRIDSRPGAGTTVRIRIPCVREVA